MQKKNNWLMKLGIGVGVLFCLWAILRVTNTLQYYSCPSAGNSPTIKEGSIIWASRFKTLQRGNFMTFKTYDSLVGGIATWVKRCVGMPGDTVQMKDGILFVNGENVDKTSLVSNEFIISTNQQQKFVDALQLTEKDYYRSAPGYLSVFLSAEQYKKVKSILTAGEDSVKQMIYAPDANLQPPFFTQLKKDNWTVDNFGPLAVPYEHYFVLGDNRHNSLDSRHIGFIKKENYVGTVLGK